MPTNLNARVTLYHILNRNYEEAHTVSVNCKAYWLMKTFENINCKNRLFFMST